MSKKNLSGRISVEAGEERNDIKVRERVRKGEGGRKRGRTRGEGEIGVREKEERREKGLDRTFSLAVDIVLCNTIQTFFNPHKFRWWKGKIEERERGGGEGSGYPKADRVEGGELEGGRKRKKR